MTSRQIATALARAALQAKAEEVVILDLRKLSFSFDYFVLCSAASDRRIRTIVDQMQETLGQDHLPRHPMEGTPEGGWVLLDYGQVVGHIFSPEARGFYDLERLWGDAPHPRLPRRR